MKQHEASTARVADLVPYARNPRTHSEKQVSKLAGSIKEFGFTNPILIDEDGGIVAGHGRVMAANKLGIEEVPCVVLKGLTEAQKKALVIADNRLAEDAGWDNELLAGLLHDLNSEDFDLTLTGFDDDEIFDFLKPADPDDMEIGSSGDEGSSAAEKNYLAFDKYKVPLTEAELAGLSRALERYIEENGAAFGFPAFLLDNLAW